jgi:UDP-N-acetylmuramyl tripeptide synthase
MNALAALAAVHAVGVDPVTVSARSRISAA